MKKAFDGIIEKQKKVAGNFEGIKKDMAGLKDGMKYLGDLKNKLQALEKAAKSAGVDPCGCPPGSSFLEEENTIKLKSKSKKY